MVFQSGAEAAAVQTLRVGGAAGGYWAAGWRWKSGVAPARRAGGAGPVFNKSIYSVLPFIGGCGRVVEKGPE